MHGSAINNCRHMQVYQPFPADPVPGASGVLTTPDQMNISLDSLSHAETTLAVSQSDPLRLGLSLTGDLLWLADFACCLQTSKSL